MLLCPQVKARLATASTVAEKLELAHTLKVANAAKAWQVKAIPSGVTQELQLHYNVLAEEHVEVPVRHLCIYLHKVAVEYLSNGHVQEWANVVVPFKMRVGDAEPQYDFDVEHPSFACIDISTIPASDANAFFCKWADSIFCEPLLRRIEDATPEDEGIAPLLQVITTFLTAIPNMNLPKAAAAWQEHAAYKEVCSTLRGVLAVVDPVPFSHGQQAEDVDFAYGKSTSAGESLVASAWIGVAKQLSRMLLKPDCQGRVTWQNRY
jgi:hypothetical protein